MEPTPPHSPAPTPGWTGATNVAHGFVGPAAGSTLFTPAAWLPGLIDAASFVVSALILRTLPPSTSTGSVTSGPLHHDIGEGLRWIRHQPLIATLAVAVGAINFATVAAITVLVLYLRESAGVGALGYSFVLLAPALGGLIGNPRR